MGKIEQLILYFCILKMVGRLNNLSGQNLPDWLTTLRRSDQFSEKNWKRKGHGAALRGKVFIIQSKTYERLATA